MLNHRFTNLRSALVLLLATVLLVLAGCGGGGGGHSYCCGYGNQPGSGGHGVVFVEYLSVST